MVNRKIFYLPAVFLMLCTPVFAQTNLLSAEEAVRIALENNYDIAISAVDIEIAQANNTKGNAGQLPIVNLVANDNLSFNAFQQKLSNGNEFNAPGAAFNSFNAGVQLNWPLLDGKRMYIAKKRLEAQEVLSKLNLKTAVQNTAANVLQNYYDIIYGKMQEQAQVEIIALNEERLRIAEARLAAGFAAQTDALQAKIDLNQRKADLIARKNATEAAKNGLNRLLARNVATKFEVIENIPANWTPDRTTLSQKILQENPDLVSLQQNADVAALLVGEAQTLNKPRVNGIGQFSTIRSDNGSGFLRNNTQAGITLGASMVMPLYSGGNLKRQIDVAQLTAKQAQLRVESQKKTIEAELENQLALFDSQKEILILEEENIKIARENLYISTERFRVGTTNGLEPQIAQNTLELALARRNTVLYNLKLVEVRLKLLSGEL